MNLIISLVIGALAGWLASCIMKSKGSWLRNIILGLLGSVVGNWLAGVLGISVNSAVSVGGILVSVAGACVLIFLGRLLFKK